MMRRCTCSALCRPTSIDGRQICHHRPPPLLPSLLLSWSQQLPLSCRAFYSSKTKGGNSKRRRKALRSEAAAAVVTTKDRMRRFVELNQVQKKPLLSVSTANQYVDLATSRLAWIKNKLYENWNPDYLKENTDASLQMRQFRKGPEMDARWWFWNVVFALLPAILLGAYCEFRGKYRMQDYYRRLEEHRLKELLGDDYVEGSFTADADKLQSLTKQDANLLQRLLSWVQEILDTFTESSSPTPGGESAQNNQSSEQHETATAVVSVPVTREEATIPIQNTSSASSVSAPSDPTLATILQRLDQLEAMVVKEKKLEKQKELVLQRNLDRRQQSNVQNRAEEEMISTWRRMSSAAADEKPLDHSTASDSKSDNAFSLTSLIHVVRENVNAATVYVQSVLGEQESTQGATTKENQSNLHKDKETPAQHHHRSPVQNEEQEHGAASAEHGTGIESTSNGQNDANAVQQESTTRTKPWWKPW